MYRRCLCTFCTSIACTNVISFDADVARWSIKVLIGHLVKWLLSVITLWHACAVVLIIVLCGSVTMKFAACIYTSKQGVIGSGAHNEKRREGEEYDKNTNSLKINFRFLPPLVMLLI